MRYSYSDNGELFDGDCDTKAEAIAEAFEEFPDADCVYVGEAVRKTIGEYLNDNQIESLLESISENAGEEYGDTVSDWLYKLSPKEVDELT